MLTISADDIDRALTFPGLVETLRAGFCGGRGAAGAPSPHDRAAGRRGVDAAADAGLDRFQGRGHVRRAAISASRSSPSRPTTTPSASRP